MTVTKETVPLEAELYGKDRSRTCRVRVLRCKTYADESSKPAFVSYSRCEIEDADDFPDGEYELRFDGHRLWLRKEAGRYLISFPEHLKCAA